MSAPWEQYQAPAGAATVADSPASSSDGPWAKYKSPGGASTSGPWARFKPAALPQESFLHRDPSLVSTTEGGPQLREAGAPGAGAELANSITLPSPRDIYNALPDKSDVQEEMSDLSRPGVPIPKFTIKPTDHPAVAVGKEVVNLAAGIPEFFESPLGIASAATGGVLPRTVAALFTADGLKNIGQEVLQTKKDWKNLTPSQKAVSVTDMVGNGALSALMARAASKAPGVAASVETAKTPAAQDLSDLERTMKWNQLAPSITKSVENSSKLVVQPNPKSQPILQPALLVNGRPVVGGATHAEIMQNAVAANKPPAPPPDVVKAFENDANHVFVTPEGQVLDRQQAAKVFTSATGREPVTPGKLDSTDLLTANTQINRQDAEYAKMKTPPPTGEAGVGKIVPASSGQEISFTPEAISARTAWLKNIEQLGPDTDSDRWDAIQNTYQTAKAAQKAVPGVDPKDIIGVFIKQGPYPKSPVVDHFFVERSKLNELVNSPEMEKQYPAGKFSQSIQPGSKPYSPRKGEPSYKKWLAGERPSEAMYVKPKTEINKQAELNDIHSEPSEEEQHVPNSATLSADEEARLTNEWVGKQPEQLSAWAKSAFRLKRAKTAFKSAGRWNDLDAAGRQQWQKTRSELNTSLAQFNQLRSNPSRVETMGASSPARAAAMASAKATRTQQQNFPAAKQAMTQLSSATTGVLSANPPVKPPRFAALRAHFNPMSLGESAKQTATVLRYMLGKRYVAEQRFDEVMAKFRNAFDRYTTPRNYQYDPAKPLPPNWELQRAIDTGDTANLTPLEVEFSTEARRLLDAAVQRVQSLKPDVLQQLHEFYFPRNWVAADGSDASDAALRLSQSHRPFAGSKSFLKARTIGVWDDALKQGLKPRYDNPADALRVKLGEMEQFASALEAHNILKAQGVRRFRYIFEKMPEGWSNRVDDPGTKVFAPPTVTIKEAYDEQIRTKTREMFQSLGIDEKRLASIGGKRWGYASESPEKVVTKFGGPDFVFWHEFGHIMDFRFPDLRPTLGMSERTNVKGQTIYGGTKSIEDKELRALADARGLGTKGYPRKAEEKMANVFDAYVRAPDLFRQTASTVFNNLLRWLELHPEVKGPLNDIRPSLRLGEGETEKFVGGPILLGDWIMPEPVARVMNNYLAPGVWAKAKGLSGIKKLGGMISNVRLISAFHGQMVGNDALASGVSLPLYDAMKAVADREPKLLKRGAMDLLKAPARPFLALAQGSKMLRSIRGDISVDQLNTELARYAVEANLRAGHMNVVDNSSRRWKQALFEARNSLRSATGIKGAIVPAWHAFLETPLALGHEVMRPVMEWFVPRMKYGLAAPMLQRIIADNPNADEWTLRSAFGKAADSVEDRVGQVTYDNLFQSRAVKDSGQLALQAYGWHLTKERMLWGAASDYFKAGKSMLQGNKPDITFRMAYLPSLALTHAIIGGTIMYALTGRRPSKLIDYLFPETGLVDAYGKPVRLALADFLKDYVGEWNAAMHGPHAVVDEWTRRLMPVWNELADMYRNKDFWNTKIFSARNFDEPEYQHVWTNLKEGVQYMAASSEPFSVKGAQRFQQSLGGNSSDAQKFLAIAGPFLGLVPAPQALTQSPAEALAAEIMRDSLPPMSKEQSAHVQAVSQLVHDLRTGKINDEGTFEARARAAKVTDKAELTRIQERVKWTPLQYQLHKLPLYEPGTGSDAMSVWDLMSDKEKVSTAPIFAEKIQRAYDGGKLDVPTTSRMVRLVLPYLKQAMAEKTAKAQRSPSGYVPPVTNRFSAFQSQ